MRFLHHMERAAIILAALLLMYATTAMGLDCSYKPPCPPGTSSQESVSCDACCVEGYAITNATDQWCCPVGFKPTEDKNRCVPNAAILKSDGTCYVMNETDACCKTPGWHTVNKYECCPDGYSLATDNDNCCTQRADGKCCPERFMFNDHGGVCSPPKPTGVIIR